jgi:hypothetical protein
LRSKGRRLLLEWLQLGQQRELARLQQGQQAVVLQLG